MTLSLTSLSIRLREDRPAAGQLIALCAWCPDAAAVEAEVRRRFPGCAITHGICPACSAALIHTRPLQAPPTPDS